MKLTKITISNFRSIQRQAIEITNNCTILVGKNEAGKTNILKAIAGGLDAEAYKIEPKDKRKKLATEPATAVENFIKYEFELTDEEIEDLFGEYYSSGIPDEVISIAGKKMSLLDFIKNRFSSGVYKYDFKSDTSSGLYYTLPQSVKLEKTLYRVVSEVSNEEETIYEVGEITGDFIEGCVEELNLGALVKILSSKLTTFIQENLPTVYYWQYKEDFLLPGSVNIETFKENPDSCKPLKNIFTLAGIHNIKEAFVNAKEEDEDYYNLLNRVSVTVTKNFVSKWKDLRSLTIQLQPDGDNILIKVKEATFYNFKDRSDGFKKFVSILLMLSTRVECGEIKDAVILIDEPDESLYPTGAKYLRDVLIGLSVNNIVIYSTHSPFMIDKSNIERHLIVKKTDKDITEIIKADESKYATDEVLLNAIGTSSFEYIKDTNIIFEGWSDCKFFELALTSKKQAYKDIIKRFKNIVGTAYAHGCQSIQHVTPLLKLSEKNILIFTDSDNQAINSKTKYEEDNGYQKENWFTFETLGGARNETIEDYINNNELLQNALNSINNEHLIRNKGDRKVMQFVQDMTKEQKNEFKRFLISNLKPEDIKDEYYSVILSNLAEKLT